MKYIVIELQKSYEDVAIITNKYNTLELAQSAYHQVLSYAAVSSVEFHSAVLMNDDGVVINKETFTHLTPGQSEPETIE